MQDNNLYEQPNLNETQTDLQTYNSQESEKYLLFVSGDRIFGVPASNVVEILTSHSATKVPLVPEYICGIINLRGQILTIVDVRMLLEHSTQEHGCVIILTVEDTTIGILVDKVEKMLDIDKNKILPAPGDSAQHFVKGMYALQDKSTMLEFDCEQLLQKQ